MARYDILYAIPERGFFESKPSLVVNIGHMVTLTPPIEPLMKRAIYGDPISDDAGLREPRSPSCASWISHRPDQVKELHRTFAAVWKEERPGYAASTDDYASWSIEQIEEVLHVFRHASERGEWIVSTGEVFSHDPSYGAPGPGSPPLPARAPCPDLRTPARLPFGGVAGGVVIGVLALVVWRHRRMSAHSR